MTTTTPKKGMKAFNATKSGGFSNVRSTLLSPFFPGHDEAFKLGGRLFLLCFSDEEPGIEGPRRVSSEEIHDSFAQGWQVEKIERSRYEVRPNPNDVSFSEGGPKAWFVVVRRV